jgi:type I restriction enzyme S subunit
MSRTIPKLRFKEFDDNLKTSRLEELITFKSGGTPSKGNPKYWEGDIPWISAASMLGKYYSKSDRTITELGLDNGSKLAPKGSLLLLVRGSMLYNKIPIGIAEKDVAFNQDLKNLLPKQDTNIDFLYQWFSSKEKVLMDKVVGTGIGAGKLDTQELQNLKVAIPSVPEQQKIASFLSAVDEKIHQLTRKKELLEQYKKGVMQQLFCLHYDSSDSGDGHDGLSNQGNQKNHSKSQFRQLRFKDENGKAYPKWEERKLGDVLDEHKMKSTGKEEVFSVSVHKGLVNQVEHLGRVFAAKNTDNYNLVKPGDLVYTKSPTGDFPLGIIKQSKLNKSVIVSPLYGVFTPETLGLGYLLHVYFESPINVTNYLASIIQKGAKNTINITNTNFLSKKMKLPVSKEEQQKIASFLSAIDTKIENVATQIEKTKTFKKGLLQQMFV